jgi:hypothetical protein
MLSVDISFTVKIEETVSPEKLLPIYETTWHLNPQDRKGKVKISLLQAMEAHRVARGQGSHIT